MKVQQLARGGRTCSPAISGIPGLNSMPVRPGSRREVLEVATGADGDLEDIAEAPPYPLAAAAEEEALEERHLAVKARACLS